MQTIHTYSVYHSSSESYCQIRASNWNIYFSVGGGGGVAPGGLGVGGWGLVSQHALRQTPARLGRLLLRTVRILLECILDVILIPCHTYCNDYYYDVQLPINHVISKTVLHLVVICITSHKHSKHMLKVCRKFSKKI